MDMDRRLARATRVWNAKTPWEGVFRECWDYFAPNRRPGGPNRTKRTSAQIFDMTGPNSARHFPGELQRLIWPVGQRFDMECAPLVANRLKKEELTKWNQTLSGMAGGIWPYFKAGGFYNAVYEAFTDLVVTNGYILPMRGPNINRPLAFACLPTDEVAVEYDLFGNLTFLNWKTEATIEAVMRAFPRGAFTAEQRKLAADKPDTLVTLYHDFEPINDGASWQWCAYLDKSPSVIVSEKTRTKPVVPLRFYVTPRDPYSLGPAPFALPTVKTQNKAQELALKAFAIQMMGIWAYRSGGTMNPDALAIAPGAFWPMQSTGGILGPDVQRMDASTGRIDLARMLLVGNQQQIKDALLDTRLTDDGGTPASASEIAAIMAQNGNIHLGAYARLIADIVDVVPRAMEILADWKLLPALMSHDQLLVSMSVNSPVMRSLQAGDLQIAGQFHEFVAGVAGPDNAGLYIHKERFIDFTRRNLSVPAELLPSEAEKKAEAEAIASRQQQQLMAAMAEKAAPNLAAAAMQPEQPAAMAA